MQRAVGRGVDGRAVRAVASLPVGRIWDEKACWDYAYRYARGQRLQEADAEDVAQRCLLKLHLAGESSPSPALLSVVAHNALVDHVRTRTYQDGRKGKDIDDPVIVEGLPPETPVSEAGDALVRGAVRRQLKELLPSMPTAPLEVMRRVYLEDAELMDVVAWRKQHEPREAGESEAAHHKRCKDWVHQNHGRGIAWLRERVKL